MSGHVLLRGLEELLRLAAKVALSLLQSDPHSSFRTPAPPTHRPYELCLLLNLLVRVGGGENDAMCVNAPHSFPLTNEFFRRRMETLNLENGQTDREPEPPRGAASAGRDKTGGNRE